jgi:DNA invertase Pin-like site-specific DNA recombinase
MPSAIAYIRFSSEQQEQGDSLRRQTELAEVTAKMRGLTISEWVRDLGVSAYKGAHIETGNFGLFLDRVKAGKIERGTHLLVENFDRLSRLDVFDSTRVVLDLYDAGLILVTTQDNAVHGRDQGLLGLLRPMLEGERAHKESVRKSDLVGRAWKSKRDRIADGHKLTGKCPAWLSPIRAGRDIVGFEPINDRAEIIRRIFSDTVAGHGKHAIAALLNRERVAPLGGENGWHPSAIHKILNNRAVIGEFQPHQIVCGKREPVGSAFQDYFPAVVDMALWNRAKAARADRTGKGGRRGPRLANIFSGLLKCSLCGGSMTLRCHGNGGDFLVCNSNLRKAGCEAGNRYRYSEMEDATLHHLSDLWIDPADLDDTEIREAENALGGLTQTREAKEREMRNLVNAIATGSQYVREAIATREADIEAIKTREMAAKAALEALRGRVMSNERQLAIDDLLHGVSTGDLRARSRMAQEVKTLLDKVVFDQDQKSILIVVAKGLRIYEIRGYELFMLVKGSKPSNPDPRIVSVIARFARIQKMQPGRPVIEFYDESVIMAGGISVSRNELELIAGYFPNQGVEIRVMTALLEDRQE